jgi:hypothetical protein
LSFTSNRPDAGSLPFQNLAGELTAPHRVLEFPAARRHVEGLVLDGLLGPASFDSMEYLTAPRPVLGPRRR